MKTQSAYAGMMALSLFVAGCGGESSGGGSGTTLLPASALRATAASATSTTPASAYNDVVQQLYIAYFGRPADTGGLTNFSKALSDAVASTNIAGISAAYASSATIKALVDAFGTSAESNALYTGTTASFVNAIYLNVFNRDGDAEGLAFWTNAIDKGGLSKGNAALSIMAGALNNSSSQGQIDASIVNNKTAIGKAFTTSIASSGQDGYRGDDAAATARTMLAGVSHTTNTTEYQATISKTITALTATSRPAAPAVDSVAASNGSASISLSAPTTGGVPGRYVASCTGGGKTISASSSLTTISVPGLANGVEYACTLVASNAAGTTAAPNTIRVTPTASTGTGSTGTGTGGTNAVPGGTVTTPGGTGTTPPPTGTGGAGSTSPTNPTNPTSPTSPTGSTGSTGSTSTASLFCNYSASVANTTLNLTSTVSMSCANGLRNMVANGIPDHVTGTFPNSGNPSVIKAVNAAFTHTLTPAVSAATVTAIAHKIGFANNGVAFDPATAESYQNAGVWKIEALNQTLFPFGVDSSNAHVQPDGTYHYHGMPEAYMSKLGKGTAMTMVGFAMDGFPIYARYGYASPTDATSAVRVMTSSYRLKSAASSGRPSTSTVAMGTFTQDYEYVAGLGDLDECNGRFGATPEFPSGIYHYYITDSYPFIQRCVKGTVTAVPQQSK
jgi:hypothetical protein